MAHYSIEKQFIFIHIPKNAGTSIVRSLNNRVSDLKSVQDYRWKTGFDHNDAFDNHYTYMQCQETFEHMGKIEEFHKLKAFAFIRNPWDRMVSLYNHRLRKQFRNTPEDRKKLNEGFTSWLTTTNHKSDKILTKTPQIEWTLCKSINTSFKLYKYEEIDLEALSYFLDIDDIKLQRHNVGQVSKELYKSYYDQVAYDHIIKYFKYDIETGEYEF